MRTLIAILFFISPVFLSMGSGLLSKDPSVLSPTLTAEDSQENPLGYSVGTFGVPPQLEQRVAFWIDIYSKYTSNEGVIHDSKYIDVVYKKVSFIDINSRSDLDPNQKRKLRIERVKLEKKEVKDRLVRLSRLSGPMGLSGEDLRYWYLFFKINDKNKFNEAAHKNRLRFQLGQKDIIEKGLKMSGRYLPDMEKIFKEKGLPIELTRLPFVESSFNYRARSKVGASGIWQFMRSTGKMYMKIDRAVDERNDPIVSTYAAAKLLKFNYQKLNDWPLAVTAYNHGANGLERRLKKYNVKTLPALIEKQKGSFGFASANFYSSFLAILAVTKNEEKFFGEVEKEEPVPAKLIQLKKSIHKSRLISWFGGDVELAKNYNPHLRKYFWKGWEVLGRRTHVRVPEQNFEMVAKDLEGLKGDGPNHSGYYSVQRGETLGGIARRLGVGLSKLMAVNGIEKPRNLRVGQKLVIPQSAID